MQETDQVHTRGGGMRRRFRATVQKAATALAVVAVAMTGMVVATAPAHAATIGAGFGTVDNSIGWQGAFILPDGSRGYCIEPGISNPLGATTDGGIQESVVSNSPYGDAAVSPDNLARINYLVSTFGQTDDNIEAAAVSFAVKALANPSAMYDSHGYSGPENLPSYVNWVLVGNAGAANAGAVGVRAQQLFDAAQIVTAGPSVTPNGTLVFVIHVPDVTQGTVTASTATPSTGTITLTGAIFPDTGSNTLAGATAGGTYAITALAPEDGSPMQVSGEALFGSTSGGWRGAVRAWNTVGQQTVAGGAGAVQSAFTMTGQDPYQRAPLFETVVATTASTYIQPGEPFVDAVNFGLAEGSASWVRSQSGNHLPVAAQGTVYGPFATQPAESEDVPADATIAGTATITTSAEGPNVTYTATSDTVAETSGFYTWVWTIVEADQGPITQLYMTDGYAYQDRFGQVVETSLVGPTVTTQAQAGAKPGETITDTAIVAGSLPTAGAELTFDAYRVPVVQDTAGAWVTAAPEGTEPGDLSWVCTDANRVWTSEPQLITAAGEYSSGPSAPVEVGTLLWVERLVAVDGHVLAEGVCGIPNETTFVLDVTTVAQSSDLTSATPTLWDTANITGVVPAGATIVFEAYRGEGVEAACATTPIFTSDPVELTAGFYDEAAPLGVTSSTFQAAPLDNGTAVTWVETTRDADGRIISQGVCGEPTETVQVARTAKVIAVVATGGFNMAPILAFAGGIGGLCVIALAVMLVSRRRAHAREEGAAAASE